MSVAGLAGGAAMQRTSRQLHSFLQTERLSGTGGGSLPQVWYG